MNNENPFICRTVARRDTTPANQEWIEAIATYKRNRKNPFGWRPKENRMETNAIGLLIDVIHRSK